MKIHLYNYKNYYNRYADKLNNIEAYSPYLVQTLYDVYNFDYGDGVNTSHTINFLETLEVKPNYLIVERDDGKFSRWYIVDGNHLKDDKEVVALHRDVVADFWTYIRTAECFVQKAIMNASGSGSTTGFDPLIFNNEKLALNQIKKQEFPIVKDYEFPWIVGFMDNNAYSAETQVIMASDDVGVIEYESWEEFPYFKYLHNMGGGSQKLKSNIQNIRYTINARPVLNFPDLSDVERQQKWNSTGPAGHSWQLASLRVDNMYRGMPTTRYIAPRNNVAWDNGLTFSAVQDGVSIAYNSTLDNYVFTLDLLDDSNKLGQFVESFIDNAPYTCDYSSLYNTDDTEVLNKLQELSKHNRFKVKGDDQLYSLSLVPQRVSEVLTINDKWNSDNAVMSAFTRAQNYSGFFDEANPRADAVVLSGSVLNYALRFEEVYSEYYSYRIKGETRRLNDAPYKMFCLPYGDAYCATGMMYKDVALKIAANISAKHSGTDLYDLQIVPYCPFTHWTGQIDETEYTPVYYSATGSSTEPAGSILWCTTSQGHFTFNIPRSPLDTDNLKVCNEAEFYRLCAPDYSSVYEYSLAKNLYNYGLDVYYTYKPYASTVAVIPQYAGEMYTGSFKGIDGTRADARGLICTGGFAMTQSGDAFAQYERQNVNYMKAFNREIESIDLNNSVAKEQDKWNAIAGTFSGISSGATTGSIAGGAINPVAGGISAAIGAIAGGALSAIGGAKDLKYNEMLRDDAKDLKQDLFNFNLGNIKALPNTLNAITSMTQANKYFPYIERYCCTDRELQMIREKITFNGMSVGAIGQEYKYENNLFSRTTLENNTHNFFQAQLIKIDLPGEDNHMANSIADELAKGIYVQVGGYN